MKLDGDHETVRKVNDAATIDWKKLLLIRLVELVKVTTTFEHVSCVLGGLKCSIPH